MMEEGYCERCGMHRQLEGHLCSDCMDWAKDIALKSDMERLDERLKRIMIDIQEARLLFSAINKLLKE